MVHKSGRRYHWRTLYSAGILARAGLQVAKRGAHHQHGQAGAAASGSSARETRVRGAVCRAWLRAATFHEGKGASSIMIIHPREAAATGRAVDNHEGDLYIKN